MTSPMRAAAGASTAAAPDVAATHRAPVPAPPGGLAGQLLRFAVIGVVSTVAYALLFLILRGMMGAQAANAVALAVTAIANTAANRRMTFRVRGRSGWFRDQAGGLVVFVLGLAMTSGSLILLHAAEPAPPRWAELPVLVVANAAATLTRFALLRGWILRSARGGARIAGGRR